MAAQQQQYDPNFLAFLQNPPQDNNAYITQQAGLISPWSKMEDPLAPKQTLPATAGGNAVTTASNKTVNITGKPPATTAARPTATPLSVDDAAYRDLVDRINNKQINSLNDQSGGIKSLEAALAKMRGENPDIDLSALTALSDSWFGGDLSKGVRKPKTKAEMEAEARDLEMGIQKARGGLAQNEIDLLQSQLGVEGRRLDTQDRLAARKIEQEERSKDRAITQSQIQAQKDLAHEEKLSRQQEKDLQEFQKRVGDTTAGSIDKMAKIDAILTQYAEGGDIPGVGVADSWKPDLLVSSDGQNLRQLTEGLKADVIRMYSGTAASDSEVRRKVQELGSGMFQTDEQFRNGIANLRDFIQAKQRNLEAGFKPEIVQAYANRGGVHSSAFGGFTFGKGTNTASLTREQKIEQLKKLRGE